MEENKPQEESLEQKLQNINETPDTTKDYDKQDIEKNKVMAILAYFGILVLVPIFGAKDSKFARFHANQGLILFIIMLALWVLGQICLAISLKFYAIMSVLFMICYLVLAVLAIMGIINAASGKAKELPLVGKYRILK
ncbi:MAG: zinc ribbon domain-containing protein [Muribaculaceae bacterium]|nr:zinc ribbon domain-containing protein [Muribaculaceae bacterium]